MGFKLDLLHSDPYAANNSLELFFKHAERLLALLFYFHALDRQSRTEAFPKYATVKTVAAFTFILSFFLSPLSFSLSGSSSNRTLFFFFSSSSLSLPLSLLHRFLHHRFLITSPKKIFPLLLFPKFWFSPLCLFFSPSPKHLSLKLWEALSRTYSVLETLRGTWKENS
jgi:hypothetical protein